MFATSTFVRPQSILIDVLINPDFSGKMLTPINFTLETHKYFIGRPILSIESYCDVDVKFSPLHPGVPVIDAGLMEQLTITLLREPGPGIEAGDYYKDVPLFNLRRLQNWVTPRPLQQGQLYRTDPVHIAWTDSFLRLGEPPALANPYAALFLVTYLLETQDPTPYQVSKFKHR